MRPPDRIIGSPADPYLLRWYIIDRNRRMNVYLHHFLRSDDDRAMHDHPWWSCSIILTVGYLEHLRDGSVKHRKPWRPWAPWRLIFRRATDAHRIELFRPCWTLFLTGPVVREWGFLCPQGWRHWREFTKPTAVGNEIGKGCDP